MLSTETCLMYMYKKDLELIDLHWSICHKTKRNQISYIQNIYYKKDLALNDLQ